MGDAGPDAGQGPCDPVAQTGCATQERCVWLSTTATTGELACVPQGTIATGAACTAGVPGPETGYDNCKRGLTCIGGECKKICDAGASNGCGPNDVCVTYVGVFADADTEATIGACQAACDPVTQQLKGGGSCGAGEGCYGHDHTFTCVKSSSVLVQGDVVSGMAYWNSCAPGFVAYKAPNGSWVCNAYCKPAVTYSGNSADAAGIGRYSCPDRGAHAPYECRFGSLFSSEAGDSAADAWGMCLDVTGRTYDHDGDVRPDSLAFVCLALRLGHRLQRRGRLPGVGLRPGSVIRVWVRAITACA